MESTRSDRRLGGPLAETTRFVGRQAELAYLGGLLEQARLVTLTGVGGVGKTRLALQAADAARTAFPDGVWLVELSPLQDPALVGHAILEALPLADRTPRPVGEVLVEWLADKRLLLVLDTCEHLIGACAQMTNTLLAAAPGLRILATSRQSLDLAGEREVAVAPLPVEPQRDTGAEHSDAAVLFAQRAAATAPGFALDEGSQEAVARICRYLDGIPLALELAAARLPELSLDELEERLHARFELLTAQDDQGEAGPGRHRMLRTTIGWSHELCTPLERLLWARLSVFAGGFDAEAAEEVCAGGPLAGEQVSEVLDGLADKSIVVWQLQDTGRSGRHCPYRMLDTVREYGRQWLRELGEEEQLRRRHRDHYLRLARQGAAQWMGPNQVDWYERMTVDHANLRAALEASLAEPDGHTALELAAALWFFWIACGFLREGRHYLERALAAGAQPSPVRTQALWACAVVTSTQGDHEAGLRWGTACQQAARDQGDPAVVRAAAYPVAASLVLLGQPARAVEVYDQVPSASGRAGDYTVAGWLLGKLTRGCCHIQAGEFARAVALAEEVGAECSARGEQWVRGLADWLRAQADLAQGNAAAAARHARAALQGLRSVHYNAGIAVAVELLAAALVAQGEEEQAARLLGIAQPLWQLVGRPQVGAPRLIAAREACERQARGVIGDAAYEAAYKAGVEMGPDEGIAYALTVSPTPSAHR